MCFCFALEYRYVMVNTGNVSVLQFVVSQGITSFKAGKLCARKPNALS